MAQIPWPRLLEQWKSDPSRWAEHWRDIFGGAANQDAVNFQNALKLRFKGPWQSLFSDLLANPKGCSGVAKALNLPKDSSPERCCDRIYGHVGTLRQPPPNPLAMKYPTPAGPLTNEQNQRAAYSWFQKSRRKRVRTAIVELSTAGAMNQSQVDYCRLWLALLLNERTLRAAVGGPPMIKAVDRNLRKFSKDTRELRSLGLPDPRNVVPERYRLLVRWVYHVIAPLYAGRRISTQPGKDPPAVAVHSKKRAEMVLQLIARSVGAGDLRIGIEDVFRIVR